MPPKPKKTNWEAIGAVAGIAGVLLALLTFCAATVPSSTPNLRPAPADSWASTYTPPQEHPGMPTAAPPSGGPPAGCEQGKAAIARYNNTVGSTPYSEQQAASRAEQDTYEAEMGSTSGTIREDLQTLSQDFAQLTGYAIGLTGGEPDASSRYNAMRAQAQKDSQVLNTDCG
jgi:hypothetical protein